MGRNWKPDQTGSDRQFDKIVKMVNYSRYSTLGNNKKKCCMCNSSLKPFQTGSDSQFYKYSQKCLITLYIVRLVIKKSCICNRSSLKEKLSLSDYLISMLRIFCKLHCNCSLYIHFLSLISSVQSWSDRKVITECLQLVILLLHIRRNNLNFFQAQGIICLVFTIRT